MKCKVCGNDIEDYNGELIEAGYFNIKFKRVPICECCANTITKQQINFLINSQSD